MQSDQTTRSAVRRITLFLLLVTSPARAAYSVNPSPLHTLLLLRHGDSVWNGGESGTHERFTGWTDVPLSNKGRYEASAAADEISTYSYEIDYCFTSHLSRALDTTSTVLDTLLKNQKHLPPALKDYRLNERHYGALQGYIKNEIEQGIYGHDPKMVKLWRRSWDIVPPLLEEDDPRREAELQLYSSLCGGSHNVPRGESLEMVAKYRVRPFLDEMLTPSLNHVGRKRLDGAATGLVIAHANSLRAIIGVICEVEDDAAALNILEALRIPTCIPLVLKYQRLPSGKYQVFDLPEADECTIEYFDGPGPAELPPMDLGHPKLPVWPLNSCIPIQGIFQKDVVIKEVPIFEGALRN